MRVRFSSLAFFVPTSLLTTAVFVGIFVACSSGDDAVSPPIVATKDGGTDGQFATDALPPVDDADPPPGDVCGDKTGFDPNSPWPLSGGCPTRAGWSSLPGAQNATVRFMAILHAGVSAPAFSQVADGALWVGTTEGDIVAVDNGAPHWAYHTNGAVSSSPAIDPQGDAIVGSADGSLYGINIGSLADVDAGDAGYQPARLIFSIALGGMITSSPVIAPDGTIYVGSTIGKLFAVTKPTGTSTTATMKWGAVTNDTNGSSPAIGQDGTVYVGSADHKLYAFHPDGTPAFNIDIGAEIKGSPSVGGDGTIYVGGVDGKLHSIDTTGKERWVYATGGAIVGTPAVYAGAVYVGSADKSLHAVSVVDGTKRWTFAALGTVASPSIGADGVIYVGAEDGHLYALNPTGSLYFAVNVKGNVKSPPAIGTSSDLYVSTDNGVVAVGP